MFAVVSPARRMVTRGPQAGREQSLSEGTKAAAVPAGDAYLRRRLLRSARSSSVILFRVLVFTSRAGRGKRPGSGVKCPVPQPRFQTLALPLSTSMTLGDLSLLETSASSSLNWGPPLPGCGEDNGDKVLKGLAHTHGGCLRCWHRTRGQGDSSLPTWIEE